VPPGGNMIKIDQLRRYDRRDCPPFTQIFLSWDTAFKATQLSGFSVCTTWGTADKNIYLLDVVRGRFDYHDLREKAFHLARNGSDWGRRPDWILVEDKASGQSLIQDMKRADLPNVVAVKPDSDKQTRMHTQTGLIADGRVFVPHDAPWLDTFLQELMAFPAGKYDDQVDSTSQALRFFRDRLGQPGIITFYEEQVRLLQKGSSEDDQIVVVKPPNDCNLVYFREGGCAYIDADGYFRMPRKEAILLRRSGWIITEPSSSS
jgi:predicted phage terminase large subunit-like protein